MPVCREPFLPPPPPKLPDVPIDSITPAYQLPKIEDEPIDVDAIQPKLNTEFEENLPQQEGIIHDVYTCRNHPSCKHR